MQIQKQIILTLILLGSVIAAAPSSGALLDFLEAEMDATLGGSTDVAFSPDGLFLYVVSFSENSLVVLQRDPGTGLLTFVEAEVDGAGGVDGLRQARAVAVSPDGNHVYAISRGDDAISVFSRDSVTGEVTFVEVVLNEVDGVEGIWQARGLAADPLGEFVIGSGRRTPAQPKGAVTLFDRDPSTGELSIADLLYNDDVMGTSGLGNGAVLAVSPDGNHIYAASPTSDSIAVFEIDRSGGSLTFVESQVQGANGVTGVTGVSDVTVSPDGAYVYFTAATDNSVATFSRDSSTGALTFIEMVSGMAGLGGASGLSISPTGEVLVVSGAVDNALAFFSRDSATGKIVWNEAQTDGVDGVEGLAGASAVIVSSDGLNVYGAGPTDSAVAAFGRGVAFDFGDAPDPSYPTLLAQDGARHVIVPGLFLGSGIDSEPDGQPAAAADGDDVVGIDDETGIIFATPLIPGQPASVDVQASAAGELDAWIDFDADGDWLDAGDQIAASVAVGAGTTNVPFVVPAAATPDGMAVARFRLRDAADPATSPTGLANSGEVEDHMTMIGVGADLDVVAVATTPTADWTEAFTITVTITNIGPNPVVGANVDVVMSPDGSGVTWTCVSNLAVCTLAGVGDISDLVDVAPGGTLVYTIEGTVIDLAPGPAMTASASAVTPPGVTDPVASNDAAVGAVVIPSIFHDGFESGDTSVWSSALP